MVAASGLAGADHTVLGVDIDRSRVDLLQSGKVPIYEPGLEEKVGWGLGQGNLRFLHRDEVDEAPGDVALIAVGTPQTASGSADLQQVRAALAWTKAQQSRAGNRDVVVVMKSTVPPGTGQRILDKELRGLGISYVSNPEFLREGSAVEDWQAPNRIVIGSQPGDEGSIAVVKKMHQGIHAPYILTDITSAEMIKYASNAFMATRISFINEIASLCERVGASIDSVSEGLAMDSRSGGRIYAGVGYGGSCFPKDVRALDYLALTSGVSVDLLRSVINVNNRQRMLPLYALRQRFNGALNGVRVGVLGLAFKPETDDVRDAPSLSLIRELVDEGVQVLAFDPQASETACRQLSAAVHMTDSPVEAAEQAQAVILLTEWPQIVRAEWSRIAAAMCPPRLLFDGRNALDADAMRALGFEYAGVGRKGLPIQ
jgi:UDPglucose 6-dehydrogenase